MAERLPHQILTPFSIASIFTGAAGAAVSVLIAIAIIGLSVINPYRQQKIALIYFGFAVIAAGIFRTGIDFSPSYNLRFYYLASVFCFWFICCLGNAPLVRTIAVCIVTIGEISGIIVSAGSNRVVDEQNWRDFSNYISDGIPLIIPVAPSGWYLSIPSAEKKRLSSVGGWKNTRLHQHAVETIGCHGSLRNASLFEYAHYTLLDPAVPIYNGANPLWKVEGRSDQGNLIVLVDASDIVQGFAFILGSSQTWTGIVSAPDQTELNAYAVNVRRNTICRLNGSKRLVVGP